jgi:uncharacterized protein YkvS
MEKQRLEKIISKFEERKKVTEGSLDDIFEIFDGITKIVDNINITTEKTIVCRASWYNSHGNLESYSSVDFYSPSTFKIIVDDGVVKLLCWGQHDSIKIVKKDIDYISLKDVQESIEELFIKLEKIGTRKETAEKIKSIRNALEK